MNIKKSLMLLSAAALLASCGGGATSSGTSQGGESETPSSVTPSNPSSNSETSSTPLSGWTTEQENLMKEHLGGHVLPYFEGDNLDVSYDSEYGCIAITFDWYEGIMDDLVDTYQNADYDSYVYYGLFNIFIADAYDADWNNVNVNGIACYENEEDLDPSFVELSAYFTVTEKEWPGDFVASYVSALGSDVEIPEFDAYSYITSQGGDYIGITCAGGFEAFEGEESYLADLEAAGWTIDDSEYESYGYFAVSPDEKVEINFFEDGTPLCIYIEPAQETPDPGPGEDTCVGFPGQYFSEWLEELGATDTEIPEFEYEGTWTRDREYEEYGWSYWYFDDETMTLENTEDAYVDILVEAGYTIDDTCYDEEGYYAYPEDDVYCIQFYYYEGQFLLGVGPYEAPEPIEEGLFDFSVETQITESSGTKAVWESGVFTFMIEKGESSVDVGNGTFFSNPLRTYAQQVITVSWPADQNVESIDFDVNTTASKSKVANFTDATLTNCTVSAFGNTVTLVPNAGVNTVSFIPTGQVHLNSAQINLAE